MKKKLGVIGKWMVFKAVSLSEVTKGVNTDGEDEDPNAGVTAVLRITGKKRVNQGGRRKPGEYGLPKASEESYARGRNDPIGQMLLIS